MDNPKPILHHLFHPRSIAVIGASRDETSVGFTLLRNIKEGAFPGVIYPINPHAQELFGVKAYPSVSAIKGPIDIAVIAVPAPIVPEIMEDIGKKQVPYAIIISSGFREIGDVGIKREEAVQACAEKYGITIIGPNCLGIINTHEKLNASFARTPALPGSIAFLSQSGAMGSALLDITRKKRIGFSHFISFGNKAGISELDLMEYLIHDPQTNVIGLYMEAMTDARRYITIVNQLLRTTPPKPVVILKAGRTEQGKKAAKSHTGSLAGNYASYQALTEQSGMIACDTTEEFLLTLDICATYPIPKMKTTAILTNAGGPSILASDIGAVLGIQFPAFAGHTNPYDLLGDATPEKYAKGIADAIKDDEIGSIIPIVTPQSMTNMSGIAKSIISQKTTKPTVVVYMGQESTHEAIEASNTTHTITTTYPETAVKAIANILSLAEKIQHLEKQTLTLPIPEVKKEPKTDLLTNNSYIAGSDALHILSLYGISVPRHVVIRTQSDLSHCDTLADTVVLKIISPDIIHKTDVGGVVLNVKKQAIKTVYESMLSTVTKTVPHAHIEGVLAMDMIQDTTGMEFVIGMKKEPDLGSLIMVGLGGVLLELNPDVAFRFAPLSYEDAEQMIASLHTYPLFQGYRGKAALHKKALIETILRISKLVVEYPSIKELDINPLLVGSERVIALDARIIMENH